MKGWGGTLALIIVIYSILTVGCFGVRRQMGMLGMDVDPPLEEGRLWELDRRTHAKEAIFSIIDKLVDIAIADGESYDCVNGEVIRADLVSKVSADWFSNALGEDAADDIQMQVTRLDAAVLQWMQEQVKGSTGKPSKVRC